jgi:hypothetical protein
LTTSNQVSEYQRDEKHFQRGFRKHFPAILLAHTAKMSENGFSKSHGQ